MEKTAAWDVCLEAWQPSGLIWDWLMVFRWVAKWSILVTKHHSFENPCSCSGVFFLSCIRQKETDCARTTRLLWKRFQEHRKCRRLQKLRNLNCSTFPHSCGVGWARGGEWGCHLPCCNSAAIFLLQGTIINDALMTFFCGLCETCRMAREVRIRNGEV